MSATSLAVGSGMAKDQRTGTVHTPAKSEQTRTCTQIHIQRERGAWLSSVCNNQRIATIVTTWATTFKRSIGNMKNVVWSLGQPFKTTLAKSGIPENTVRLNRTSAKRLRS